MLIIAATLTVTACADGNRNNGAKLDADAENTAVEDTDAENTDAEDTDAEDTGMEDPFIAALDSVTFTASATEIVISCLDSTGETIGVIAMRQEGAAGEGEAYILTADYQDGGAMYVAYTDLSSDVMESLPGEVLAARAAAIEDWVRGPSYGKGKDKGKSKSHFACAVAILGAVGACGGIKNPWACPATVIGAVCACRDEIKDVTDFDFSVCDELG